MRKLGFVVFFLALATACDSKPKPEETKKSEPVPVPSDMVFNDFLPQGGSSTGLGVRDAGIDGALAQVNGGGAADDPGGGAPAGGGEKLKVTDAGADPKVARKYTFVANRVDKRLLSITQNVTQSAGGQTQPGQEVTLKLALDLTVKQAKPTGASIEAKLTKADLPGAPPQAAQMLASLNGLTGTFDVTSHGEAGEVSFAANAQMKNQLAENVVQGLSQAVQLLLAPLPETPIGVGAKWELAPPAGGQGAPDQGTKKFTLKEVNAEGGVVEAEIDIKVPRRATQGPRGGTMFVEVEGKGKYTYQVKFDRTCPKVEGELTIVEKLEVPAGTPGAPPGAGKQQVTQTQKVKHLIEAAK